MSDVHLLLATIPVRRCYVEGLLESLSKQTLVPSRIHLCLDGYGDLASPEYSSTLPVIEYRTAKLTGPGGRWRIVKEISLDAILVVLDDDQQLLGPDVVSVLAQAVEHGGAAAYMGTEPRGWHMVFPKGTPLICMGAGSMALRVADLVGLDETLAEIQEKCGFDPFGDTGDDEAVIAAHLWRKGVPMFATGPLAITTAWGTRESSQQEKRQATKGNRSSFWQKEGICRVTGWPWVPWGTIG